MNICRLLLIKRITDARKRAKEKGVGPVSLLSKISEKKSA